MEDYSDTEDDVIRKRTHAIHNLRETAPITLAFLSTLKLIFKFEMHVELRSGFIRWFFSSQNGKVKPLLKYVNLYVRVYNRNFTCFFARYISINIFVAVYDNL